jgi:hypothetical protein
VPVSYLLAWFKHHVLGSILDERLSGRTLSNIHYSIDKLNVRNELTRMCSA